MLTKKDYDSELYHSYLNNYDYDGAINYLHQLKFETEEDRLFMNNTISSLEKKRDKLDYYSKNNPQAVEAFKFIEAVNEGSNVEDLANSGNNYAKRFVSSYGTFMDSLTKQPIVFDSKIHKNYTLGIDWLNSDDEYKDDGWDLFLYNLGIDKDSDTAQQQLKDLGINYEIRNDGRYSMTVENTGNYKNALKIMQALNNTNTNHDTIHGRLELDDDTDKAAKKRWEFDNEHMVGDLLSRANKGVFGDSSEVIERAKNDGMSQEDIDTLQKSLDEFNFADKLTIPGLGKTVFSKLVDIAGGVSEFAEHKLGVGSEIFDSRDSLEKVNAVFNDAKKIHSNFLNPQEEDNITTDVKIFSGMPTMEHGQLLRDLANGVITTEQFNLGKKQLDEAIIAKLANDTGGYLNNDIYAVEEDATPSEDDAYTLSKLTNAKDRQAIINEISGNIARGTLDVSRDISYAVMGGSDGLLVTISPDIVKKDGMQTIGGTRRQIFIKNFINTPMTEKFRQSHEFRAIQQINECLLDGQPLNVSTESGVKQYIQPAVTYDMQGNAAIDRNNLVLVTTNGQGLYKEEPISKQSAYSYLNKRMNINDAVDYAVNSMYDPNGKYRNNPNLDKQLDQVVNAALMEAFPEEVEMAESGDKLGYDTTNQKTFIKREYDKLMEYIKARVNDRMQLDQETE